MSEAKVLDGGIEKVTRLRYNWDDFYKDVDVLYERLKVMNNVDAIIGIARGGFRLGVILAYKTKKPFYAIRVKSYQDDKKLDRVFIKKIPGSLRGKRVMLADDIVDTSDTMVALCDKLKRFGVDVVCKMVLCKKDKVQFECDAVRTVDGNMWVEFPWE